MSDSFWTGGQDAYEKGLRQHYDRLLRDLHARVSCCSDDDQRVVLEVAIERAEKEFHQKIREINTLLF